MDKLLYVLSRTDAEQSIFTDGLSGLVIARDLAPDPPFISVIGVAPPMSINPVAHL